MVQILLMLEALFTQDPEVEDLFCVVLLLALNPACSSAIISSDWGLICSIEGLSYGSKDYIKELITVECTRVGRKTLRN